jgi:hypothetical protein
LVLIKLEKTDVYGWEAAIRGMRNPMNSWDKSDSYWTHIEDAETQETAPFEFFVGENDLKLMKSLSKGGNDHGKFLRMITVTVDITAPLYWWKEFDTYKVGTVANSCSTMHKIHDKEFTLDDFSHEKLSDWNLEVLQMVVDRLEANRKIYLANGYKWNWEQMIQLLPSSYNQKRTVQLNYQVLKSMYFARRHHKLDEWREFCTWCESLPYFKEIVIQE